MNQKFEIENNTLMIGGCSTVELAEKFGTPLYVMNEEYIRKICRGYVDVIKEENVNAKVMFASKAFSAVAIYKIVEEEGLGIDVVSYGELYTAVKADFPREKIYYHGNNKTDEELEFAISENVGCIVIDYLEEIDRISDIAKKLNKTVTVSIRVKPGVGAHTHEYIQTAKEDSKFGLGIHDNMAMQAVKNILDKDNLKLLGFHCHIGSQIFEVEPFIKTIDIFIDFMQKVKNETGHLISEINMGGGYGIYYTEEDKPLLPQEYFKAVIDHFKEQCQRQNIDLPIIAIEPGRSIVGESGITLYRIGAIKDLPGIRKYVSIDGGMTDNIRPSLYQAKYSATIANKADETKNELVTIAGRCCESGDVLIKDIELQPIETGDILAVFSTGAYGYSMANNYNKVPIPAVVLVNNGKSEIIVRRQTMEDLTGRDQVPSWL